MKDITRKDLLFIRDSKSLEELASSSESVCETLYHFIKSKSPTPCIIAAYWAINSELNLKCLIKKLHSENYQIMLPVVIKSQQPLAFAVWTPDTFFEINKFGISEPISPLVELIPDIVLVPMVGYTNDKHRIGYGGGFYDRTLGRWNSKNINPIKIGISWADCVVPKDIDLQVEPHDVPMDFIATEKEIF
ncbi:5-formyltetrahydrofolate cyclo-ligase [Taylorella equigenitalis]|uniref:5-formyltetrahydrofolate cyclo-ligase n=2 Tax=Taylorella equigenitalis TaxID=29575 RepID=I7IY44_9BURK|nr:5-formyltetrahydrofolate cyclo-ligase [Taylorella equigenitalis]AFN36463.1 5-formyltetrahydrofolate cyclo-ligase family protein [Taylorella equigenitalis ATCC 35865]ASY31031.1 5-formyltetrahydrofolate cyclo-ligase [Taylorella equigenitalis]ASY38334.1 5-formyltetrahydrofolate cyclo-ligase [Taylorella equigenitalis]ASY39863.1 5-formyltetrahydrofolate cyclo-ligase [Taylorella equigenitalis]ASY41310.1 5-formyltetrahydrofolate cyclo-ligase [Taylorella equigenitalis]